MNVQIAGQDVKIRAGTLSIDDAINERSTASFEVRDDTGTAVYQKGQQVLIWDDIGFRAFGGVIDQVTAVRKISPSSATKIHSISCADWHYLADKRVIAKAYYNTAAGDIVKDIVTNILAIEGITTQVDPGNTFIQHQFPTEIDGIVQTVQTGPIITEAVFNYVPCTQAFDAIAEKAGFVWFIDEYKRLWFIERSTNRSPWEITGDDILGDPQLGHGNPQYRNRQIVRGVKSMTDAQPFQFTGDGEAKAWALGFPLAKVPQIFLNSVQKTVGIKGVETGKDFYWSKGDPIITQEESAAVLISSDVLTGTFIGEFDSVVISANFTEIETRKSVEGGSGIVEDVTDEPGLSGLDAAYQSANAKLRQYGSIGYKLSFVTRRYGMVAGQIATVNLANYGLDNVEMLIQQVTIQDDNGVELWYQVEAVEGAPQGSWTKLFATMASKQAYIIHENIGENEVLIYPVSFSKTWADTDHPNIFKQIYPGEATFPAANLYPSFAVGDRVKFMAWLDPAGVELGRKPITKQVDLDANRLLSTVFLNPWEANVEMGYIIWIGGVHSDVEVDRQAYAHTKTQLEGLQVEKTDTKGW